MNGSELKRVRRIALIQFVCMLLLVVGIVTYFSFELRKLNEIILATTNKPAQVIRGVDGKDGLAGLATIGPQGANGANGSNGHDGSNGANGQNITADQIAAAVSQYLNVNPVAAVQGIPGKPAPSLHVQVNRVNCQLESQYDGDDGWTTLAQLPLPCEAKE